MSYHFIRSAAVRSYECRGKETWFQLQVSPVDEPVYRIYRRYDDFLRLDAQLDNIYATEVAHSQTTPDFAHETCHSNSRRRVLSYSNRLCETSCSSATAVDHTQISLPSLRSHRPAQEIYWLANKRAKRKWQQQHIDRYLSRLFAMPLDVSQSPVVLRFLNYQPYRYYHYTKSLPPTPPTIRRRRLSDTSHPLSTNASPFLPSSDERQTGESTAVSSSANVTLKADDNNKSTRTISRSVTLIPQHPPSFIHSWNDDTIQIFLFLSPRVFITVRVHRRATLDELRSALDKELTQSGLDPLPSPSVLAYHHVSRSDRQGALYTLTLNCSEPWLDQDTLMTLASARNLALFSKAANYVPPPVTQSDQHRIQQGIVLLIASDVDLETAMNGKWRRLDYVTLTCLAW
ncbi:hypothetical protein BJV82DRAFT_38438 [Fennellomyces sp. T-0311]|nr:hypothetical protein BJV82DRAFT_38438 [Fennellomyces sp. T-0311]